MIPSGIKPAHSFIIFIRFQYFIAIAKAQSGTNVSSSKEERMNVFSCHSFFSFIQRGVLRQPHEHQPDAGDLESHGQQAPAHLRRAQRGRPHQPHERDEL